MHKRLEDSTSLRAMINYRQSSSIFASTGNYSPRIVSHYSFSINGILCVLMCFKLSHVLPFSINFQPKICFSVRGFERNLRCFRWHHFAVHSCVNKMVYFARLIFGETFKACRLFLFAHL